jgi:hypothetical protein
MIITAGDSGSGILLPGLARGIYPYLGGSVSADELRSAVREYGCAIVPGRNGAKVARGCPGALVDPFRYCLPETAAPDPLFQLDEWRERQRAARVPIFLTDSPRIVARDRAALRQALRRWAKEAHPALAVLPLDPWWLRAGLSCLIDEVSTAHRPVAVVLMDAYNGLDAAGAVAGLAAFVSAVAPLPVVLARCDVSAVGAVACGAFAGLVGISSSTRHGAIPMSRSGDQARDDERDDSPSVFVPALHAYLRSSKLPAISRGGANDILRCYDSACAGESLLQVSRLTETNLKAARTRAYRHNMAAHEQLAQRVFSADEPKDAWWEQCKSGADQTAALIEQGISLSVPRWLRQWLELGSPSHEPTKAS